VSLGETLGRQEQGGTEKEQGGASSHHVFHSFSRFFMERGYSAESVEERLLLVDAMDVDDHEVGPGFTVVLPAWTYLRSKCKYRSVLVRVAGGFWARLFALLSSQKTFRMGSPSLC
jgi:hypothetical protein